MTTQNKTLIEYLRGTGNELTPEQAEDQFGIKNLTARISELRIDGYGIRHHKLPGTTAYSMVRRMSWESNK